MTWSTPITFADNDILTAAQYNQSVRDNLLETAPAKATGSGNWFTVIGENQLAQRAITSATVSESETTTSTSYVDLDTFGPSVTVSCKFAIVMISAHMRNDNASDGKGAFASVAVSGGSTIAPSDEWMASSGGVKSGNSSRIGSSNAFDLTDAVNTFTMKYRTQVGYSPARFARREIVVIGL